MVVRPKHVADNLNKIVNNYANSVPFPEPDLIHVTGCKQPSLILKLVVCILLRVLGQVQGFRLTQHRFEDGHKTETWSG
jgi:hypothetical protein